METYDILMIVVLVAATLFGAWKGLAWQIASLAAIVASYYVAFNFRDRLAEHIHTTPPWNVFLAMLLLYVGTSFVIWVAFRLVSGIIDRVKLKEFDRQIGALFGLAKGVLLCVIITLFAVTLATEAQRQAIIRSKSGYYIAVLLDKSDPVLPKEVREVLHPYIHQLDGQIQKTALPESFNFDPTSGTVLPRVAEQADGFRDR
jgi:membrane protein required for colicin V production